MADDNPFKVSSGGGKDDTVQISIQDKPHPAPSAVEPAPSGGENPWSKPAGAAQDEPAPTGGKKKIDNRKVWIKEGRAATADELRRWEKSLVVQEESYAQSDDKLHNWPSWPRPCTRYAPDEDIVLGDTAEDRRDWVKKLYYCWFANMLGLFWNFISMCAYVNKKDGEISLAFLAATYFCIGGVGSFFGWMKMGYKAAETESNLLYLTFLIFFGLTGAWWAAMAVGVEQAAMAGFITMVVLYDADSVGGTMCLVGFIMYCLLALVHLYLWFEGNGHFRATGGVEKAKEEMRKEGAKKAIQNAI
jgi:hypothetical protein